MPAFAPDDSVLFSADDDSLLASWDLPGIARSLADRGTPLATGHRAGRLLLAPDGTTAALGAGPGTVPQLFDLATGELRPSELAGTTVTAAAWRPTGELATAGTDGVIRLWDASRGVESAASRVANGAVSALGISADGARVIVVERRGAVTLLDAATLDVVREPLLVDAELLGGALSADASTAAVFTVRGDVRLVDLGTGTIQDVDGGGLDVVDGAFAPDGDHLAVASRDGRVAFVDVRNGDLRSAPTAAHSAEVTSLSFDAGGTWLVTSGDDGVVAVWNAVDGVLLDTVATPAFDRGVSARFIGETSELLIVDATGQTYRWDLGTDAMVEHACAVVGRRLDEQEWQRFFGDVPAGRPARSDEAPYRERPDRRHRQRSDGSGWWLTGRAGSIGGSEDPVPVAPRQVELGRSHPGRSRSPPRTPRSSRRETNRRSRHVRSSASAARAVLVGAASTGDAHRTGAGPGRPGRGRRHRRSLRR